MNFRKLFSNFKSLFIAVLILQTNTTFAEKSESGSREKVLFNDGWKFKKHDAIPSDSAQLSYESIKSYLLPARNFLLKDKSVAPKENPGNNVQYVKPEFDDSNWRSLDLPHDWAIEGPFDINYEGATGKLPYWGVAWYRKTFDLPAKDTGKSIFLDIDGAMSYSAVWCNGQFVGGWPYGYASYRLDLTSFLKPGAKNVIAIRLDNPKESSRWYPGAGIYRNVWLVKTSPVHVTQWGTVVRNKTISKEKALMDFALTIDNKSGKKVKLNVKTSVFKLGTDDKPVGKELATITNKNVELSANGQVECKGTFSIKNPELWTPETPVRYVAITKITDKDKELDQYSTIFGVRDIVFDLHQGFMLNGKKVYIKGVCMHHDFGALGAAFNTAAAERQLRILKEMGVNAIRTSHNPPAPELVQMCDKMGFLLQPESFDAWKKGKRKNDYSKLFGDWAEADMRALVRHYRNNPSVIMWSIGNEVPDQTTKDGVQIAEDLTSYCHNEDPTRPTTMGCNKGNVIYLDIVNKVDIIGLNYNHRYYPLLQKNNPDKRGISTETSSATSSRGEYFFPVTKKREDSQANFQLSSYDMVTTSWGCAPEKQFKMNADFPAMSGEFVWTGFDYLGEPTPYNSDMTNLLNFSDSNDVAKAKKELEKLGKIKSPSRSSYFGILDLCGFPKDRYYSYLSYWRPEIPTVHILPHWNWSERVGKVTPVHIYTSGDEVELFLNGKSLGKRTKTQPYDRLTWDEVIYEPGELKAIAYKKGAKWAEEIVKTTGIPSNIKVTPEKTTLQNDGVDLAFVRVDIVDKDGLTVPRSKNTVKFSVTGPIEIAATDNGDATSLVSFQSNVRDAYNGLCQVIIRSLKGKSGEAVLTVESEGLPTKTIRLNVVTKTNQ